jgi:hypothetical protein
MDDYYDSQFDHFTLFSGEEQEEKKQKSQTRYNVDSNKNISSAKDTLLPIMDVETHVDDSSKGTKLRRTYSSCDLVYTKPVPEPKRTRGGNSVKSSKINNKNSKQYHSHEVLSSGASSSTNTESSGNIFDKLERGPGFNFQLRLIIFLLKY